MAGAFSERAAVAGGRLMRPFVGTHFPRFWDRADVLRADGDLSILYVCVLAGFSATRGRADRERRRGPEIAAGLSPRGKEEAAMPVYEYLCRKCNKEFSLTVSIKEHDAKKARCPKCNSASVVRQFSSFFAQTSKKS